MVIKSFKNDTLFAVAVVLAFICALFVFLYKMEPDTIKGMAWVAGTGAVGTMIACGCFKAHTIFDDLYRHCGEVYIK